MKNPKTEEEAILRLTGAACSFLDISEAILLINEALLFYVTNSDRVSSDDTRSEIFDHYTDLSYLLESASHYHNFTEEAFRENKLKSEKQ